MITPPTVLIIDHDHVTLRAMGRTLAKQGYKVFTADDGESGIHLIQESEMDIALIDMELPGIDGIATLQQIKKLSPGTECVILTGVADITTAHHSLEAGASDYFVKPINDWTRFQQILRRAAQVRALRREAVLLRRRMARHLASLFGHSQTMEPLRNLVEKVADSTASILVMGESGVGKEVVAEEIHRMSGRQGNYVKINCAALPGELLEAELFGYARGAHSTATQTKPGLMEIGEHGTVLLDEISNMSYDMQAKLLRVLENNTFRRLGETTERHMTARVIAATNANLEKAIESGRFREDLYHRLNVIQIVVPPLRARTEDIPMLTYRFIEVFNKLEGRRVHHVPDGLMRRLKAYDWPGNVRELRNLVHRAVLLSTNNEFHGGILREILDSSPGELRQEPVADTSFSDLANMPFAEAKRSIVHNFTVKYLRYHLALSKGNITHAARAAGLQRPNFRRLMKQYGVPNHKKEE
ncbi:MAG: sigma-54-dependent Fis family transcriptional regulator [Proteobacteria bacterium]|nr:sigma-54-dependent Fis family transcriptional regulator [Pseudomonadota bacterium]